MLTINCKQELTARITHINKVIIDHTVNSYLKSTVPVKGGDNLKSVNYVLINDNL